MIPRRAMKVLTLRDGDDGAKVTLKSEVIDKFIEPVTRLPVLDENGVARFIIHQSMVFKFVAEKTFNTSGSIDTTQLTLKDFLD